MQRNLLKTLTLSRTYDSLCENPTILQFIRWRKRRWAPVSASKQYFVPVKPERDPEDWEELRIRYPRYQTTLRALTNHFIEHLKSQRRAEVAESVQMSQKLEIKKILEINDKWNKETALIREARLAEAEKAANEERLAVMIKLDEEEKQRHQLAASMVLEHEEASKNYISGDNLELEIEKALDDRSNYNFAIDLEGNQYIETGAGLLEVKEPEQSNTQTKQAEQV